MTPDLLQWAASLGVGGILAGGMFAVYRKDARDAQDRLAAVQQNTVFLAGKLIDAVAVLAAHAATLDRLAQRLDDDEDG